jgi:hypothetical protein
MAFLREQFLVLFFRRLCQFLLFIAVRVDARAILCASVVPLSHALCRVMALPKHLQDSPTHNPDTIITVYYKQRNTIQQQLLQSSKTNKTQFNYNYYALLQPIKKVKCMWFSLTNTL